MRCLGTLLLYLYCYINLHSPFLVVVSKKTEGKTEGECHQMLAKNVIYRFFFFHFYFSRTAKKSLVQIGSNIYFSLLTEIKLSSSLLDFFFLSQIGVYVKPVQLLFLFVWQKEKKIHSKLKAKAIIPGCVFVFWEMTVGLAMKTKLFF